MIHFSTPEQLAAYHSGPANTVLWLGNSGIVAQDAQHKFCLGLHSVAYSDGHMQVISPVGSAGHIHLCANHPEGFDRYSPMVSGLLHLMIVDILATSVALRIGGDTSHPMLREISHNLRSKRYTKKATFHRRARPCCAHQFKNPRYVAVAGVLVF